MRDARKTQDTSGRLDRRQFITTALTGAGALMATSGWAGGTASAATSQKRLANDIVTVGQTGVKISRLAQGTGVRGGARTSAHSRMGVKASTALIRHGLDQGIVLMDTADLYGVHASVQTALAEVNRDNYAILSKIWPRQEFWNSPSGGARREVDRFRKEYKTDHLDICLIHCMTHSEWPKTYERIRDELSELKQEGAVGAVGVSCHDLGALKVAATHDWVDVIFSRINNQGAKMDGTPEVISAVLKQARANGKHVVGMKIFGEGTFKTSEERDASLKYVFGNELVDSITIGMLTQGEIDNSIQRVNKALS